MMRRATSRLPARAPLRLAAALAAALASAVAPAAAQEPAGPGATDYGEVIRHLRGEIPAYMTQRDVPGLAIALIDGDSTVWAEGFGHTDRTRETPVTAGTLFSLQSISKTYTATALLRAAEDGLLDLDDRLRDHLPGFTVNSRFGADAVDRITLRHLLSHRAGFGHEAPVGGNFYAATTTFADHVGSVEDMWLHFPPGENYSYSNVGIDLAGHVLARVVGQPFHQVLHDRVFDPLGMDASTADQRRAHATAFAHGHAGERQVPDMQIVIVPSGGVYSTARDMARYVAMHLAGGVLDGRRFLSDASLREMYTPQLTIPGQEGGYGLGVAVYPRWGARYVLHGGGGYGYSTHQGWVPELGVGVVVLTNQSGNIAGPVADSALTMMIRAKHGALPPTEEPRLVDAPPADVAADRLARLEGTYIPRAGTVPFLLRDGTLHVVQGRDTTALTAHSPTLFSASGQRYDFELDDDRVPTGVWATTCCSRMFWARNDGPRDPQGPDRAAWHDLVGRYRGSVYGADTFVSLEMHEGWLYLGNPGGFRLVEHAPGLFFKADGEPVLVRGDTLLAGNRPFVRVREDDGR